MTREEFESILEEAYIEGYNTAIEDIQEDILDEEAFDLENEYEYYTESKNVGNKMKELRDEDEDGNTIYRNGTTTVSYRSNTPHPKAINKGLNWSSKTDNGTFEGYKVKEKHPRGKVSRAIGRIKVGEHDTDEVFKNPTLQHHIAKNAEMVAGRKLREIAAKNLERANKPGLFKNKGNKY
jgi:hypothetical protein